MRSVFLFFLAVAMVSCADDDTNFVPVDFFTDNGYFIAINEECSNGGQVTSGNRAYCVSFETYSNLTPPTQPCTIITFTDIDGIERSGYGASYGTGSCSRSANSN